MKAKELLRRYRQGERNFRGVNLRGESLRGFDLKGIDLSEADLTKTDLRGTKFVSAALIDTQFCEAKIGTRRRWAVLAFLFAFALAMIAAFVTGAFVTGFLIGIIEPSQAVFGSGSDSAEVIAGIAGLSVIAVSLYFNYRQGILAAVGAVAFWRYR